MFRLNCLTRPESAVDTDAHQTVGRIPWSSRTPGNSDVAARRVFRRLIPAISIVAAFSLTGGPIHDDAKAKDDSAAASGPPALAAGVETPPPPTVRSKPAPQLSIAEQEMVEWARGLFEAAGLGLPEVVVSFHDNAEACHGSKGRWERADGIADRVMVCNTHADPQLQEERRRRTLVHEFAHAWAASALDEAAEDRFLQLRGLADWNDRSQKWNRRGIEHAAEIISWGVIDEKMHLGRIEPRTCPALATAYYLLTGTQPATGLEESCRLITEQQSRIRSWPPPPPVE